MSRKSEVIARAAINLILGGVVAALVAHTHGYPMGIVVFIALGYVSDIREELRAMNAARRP